MRDTGVTDSRYIVEIGSERFDPKADGSKARRRVTAGKKKLAKALGIDLAELPGAEREAWLVQFADDPDAEQVRRLHDVHGLHLTQRISSIANVERMNRKTAAKVRRDPAIRAVVPYPPRMKLHLMRSTIAVAGARYEVGLIEGDDADAVGAALDALGFNLVLTNDGTHAGVEFSLFVEATQSADLSVVAAMDDVAWITELGTVIQENFDSSAVAQSGDGVNHPIWDKGLTGKGMVIGVIDAGEIDVQSIFLGDGTLPGPGHPKVVQNRQAHGVTSNQDDNRHATRVVGCVAAHHKSMSDVHPGRGGAWAAKIAYGDFRRFSETLESTLADELEEAGSVGARIHSNSWRELHDPPAMSPLPYDNFSAKTDDFLWRHEDHLYITSAPNPDALTGVRSPTDPRPEGFSSGPVVAKNPITVGGVKAWKLQDIRCDDPVPITVAADPRRKPDLLAVAEDVITADIADGARFDTLTDGIRPNKDPVLGNSFATPHVAAAAALVRQYFIEGWYPKGKREGRRREVTPSGALLKAMLMNATVPLVGRPYPSQDRRKEDGWGRLELDRTLHFEGDDRFLWIRDVRHSEGLASTGGEMPFLFDVPVNARSMKITLVFNDRKGDPQGEAVVNQLEIEVLEPMPSVIGYLGNDFTANLGEGQGGPRLLQSLGRDLTDWQNLRPNRVELKNNVRQVLLDAPMAGKWIINVRAWKIEPRPEPARPPELAPGISQGFALVASAQLT